jgi:hypothetical protein
LEKILNPLRDSDLDFFCALSLIPYIRNPRAGEKKSGGRKNRDHNGKKKDTNTISVIRLDGNYGRTV